MKEKIYKFYWLWMPIVHCVLLALGLFILGLVLESLPVDGDNLGLLVCVVILEWFYILVVAPLMSISYCKKIRTMGRSKYLYCLYNAVMTGMYLTICSMPAILKSLKHGFIYVLLGVLSTVINFSFFTVFFSCLISGLITLKIYDVRKNKSSN